MRKKTTEADAPLIAGGWKRICKVVDGQLYMWKRTLADGTTISATSTTQATALQKRITG